MKSYLEILTQLDPQRSLSSVSKKQVLLLSGQSDYVHSELSKEQLSVLRMTRKYNYEMVDTGFPFNIDHRPNGAYQNAGLLRASQRNITQFLFAIWSQRYQHLIADHLQPFFDRAEHVLILCQSQGLHMLQKAIPHLRIKEGIRVLTIAFGPVGSQRFQDPRFNVHVVKGEQDWISRFFDPHPAQYIVPSGHLDYFHHEHTFKLIGTIIENED